MGSVLIWEKVEGILFRGRLGMPHQQGLDGYERLFQLGSKMYGKAMKNKVAAPQAAPDAAQPVIAFLV